MLEVAGAGFAVPATGAASTQRRSGNGRSFDSVSFGSVWARVCLRCRRLDGFGGRC